MERTRPSGDLAAVEIAGYDYGRPPSAKSPLSVDELRQIEQTTGWSDDDAEILRPTSGRLSSPSGENGQQLARSDWLAAASGQMVLWSKWQTRQ